MIAAALQTQTKTAQTAADLIEYIETTTRILEQQERNNADPVLIDEDRSLRGRYVRRLTELLNRYGLEIHDRQAVPA